MKDPTPEQINDVCRRLDRSIHADRRATRYFDLTLGDLAVVLVCLVGAVWCFALAMDWL